MMSFKWFIAYNAGSCFEVVTVKRVIWCYVVVTSPCILVQTSQARQPVLHGLGGFLVLLIGNVFETGCELQAEADQTL